MNTSIFHARRSEQYRPRTNDERMADWAQKYFLQGHHRTPQKPRVRVQNRPQHSGHEDGNQPNESCAGER